MHKSCEVRILVYPCGKLARNTEPQIVLAKIFLIISCRILHNERVNICRLSFDVPRVMGILNVTPDSFPMVESTLLLKQPKCI